MIRRIFHILTVAAGIFLLGLALLAIPSFFDPEFEVINSSPEAVSVVAEWRSTKKDIGNIQPMSSYHFSVDDEAAMSFTVHYSSGKQIETEPIYFTSGIKVIATISSDAIKVNYDHETP